MWKSIGRTTLGIAAAGIIVGSAWKNHKNFVEKHMAAAEQEMLASAEAITKNMENYIAEHLHHLEILAKITEIKQQVYEKRKCTPSVHPGNCICHAFLDNHKTDIDAFYLIDDNGIVLDRDPVLKKKIGMSLKDRPGVAYVLKNHKPFVSKLFLNRQDESAISILAPVFHNGKFTGMVRWMTRMTTIADRFLKSVKIGENGFAVLLGDNGTIYHHPDRGSVGKNIRRPGTRGSEDKKEEIINAITNGEAGYADMAWDILSREPVCLAWSYVSTSRKPSGVAGIKLRYGQNVPRYLSEKKARVIALELDKRIPKIENLIDINNLNRVLKDFQEKYPNVVELTIHGPRSAKDDTLVYKASTSPGLEGKLSDSEDMRAIKEDRCNIQFVKQREGRPHAGMNVIDVTVPIHTSEEIWPVVVVKPHADIIGPINRNARSTVAYTGLLLLLFGAGGFVLYQAQKKKALLQAEAKNLKKIAETSTALKESEEKFRTFMETASDLVSITDKDGNFIYVNNAMAGTLGYTGGEMIGMHVTQIISEEKMEQFRPRMKKIIADGKIRFESVMRAKDGKKIHVEINLVTAYDSSGKFAGERAIVRNVTERKKAEKTLKMNLKEKDVLLREVNHRVKNNLNMLSSLLAMQLRETKNTNIANAFSEYRSRIYAITLLHNLLNASGNFQEINMADFIKQLVNTTAASADIVSEIDADSMVLPIEKANPCGLIINEFITNSVKYAFRKGASGKIRISMKKKDEKITLLFTDDGAGLPGNFNIREDGRMGLKLVRLLTEGQLHGTLEHAGRGKGTVFKIVFPA